MTLSNFTVGPLTNDQIHDLMYAYLALRNDDEDPRGFSEGFLRDLLWESNGLNFDNVKALWYDAVERGVQIAERFQSLRISRLENSKESG